MEISATTTAEAWLAACEHVAATPRFEARTIVLRVASPVRMRARDRAVVGLLDAFLAQHGGMPNHTVAETIFPGYEYMRRGIDGVFAEYPDALYPKLEKHPRRGWGRYAQRMLRRTRADGTIWNPLENTIEKLRNRHGSRSAFEVGVSGAADTLSMEGIDIDLYDDNADGKRFRPLPCLSHLCFHVLDGDQLHLTALYRSHYYVQRLYGNLLGLARLQDFLAQQTELKTGELVCHSTFARLEHGGNDAPWKKRDVEVLLAAARESFQAPAQL
jgi:hypothetical protein